MKKTQWIELLHIIRSTIVSFVSIVLFATLATGLFLGIKWTVSALGSTMDSNYSRDRFRHFELSFPYGFDQEFMDSLIEDGLADEVEGLYESYNFYRTENDRLQVKIVSLTENIDRPYCYEGELPTEIGEIAVNRNWATAKGVAVGDEITFENEGTLTTQSFKVTALIGSAEYMGRFSDANGISPVYSAPIDTVMYVTEQSISHDTPFGYPKVVIRTKELEGMESLSDEYSELSDKLMKKVEDAATAYASQDRFKVLNCQAYVSSRLTNFSFVGVRNVMDTFSNMRYSLVSLFVIITLLVCYSTVSRLVYDQTVLIGTKKAIGFFTKDILKPFLIYAGVGVAAGTGVGTLLARFLIESVMVESVRNNYKFDGTVFYFSTCDVLIFALLQIVLMLITALLASISVSKRPPLNLLVGESDNYVHQFEWLDRVPLWNRISLMKRTIIRNCLTDPRRAIATLVGVMGCTSLVVSSLSMYNNLVNSFDTNMDKISRYDTVVYFSGENETREKLSSLFDEHGIEYTDANYSYGSIRAEDGKQLATGVYVTDDSDLFDFLHLYDIEDGTEKQAVSDAWVNYAYLKNFGGTVGDILKYTDSRGQEHDFDIEGIYEYYLMNYQLVLPRELYEVEFEDSYKPNVLILNTVNSEFEELKPQILDEENDLIIGYFYQNSKSLYESILGIARAVTCVYIVLSAILAALVLLNLFTMFVNEKRKELVTLRVNGFSLKDAERYIYRDTVFLTIIGIALGIVLGIFMGNISLKSFNNDSTCFMNRVDIKACVIGAVFTAIMTLIMCRIAIRKIKHFPLA